MISIMENLPRHIYRYANPYPCFQVRIRLEKKESCKTFFDSHYPNQRATLDAAIKWRNSEWDRIGILKTERNSRPRLDRYEFEGYIYWRVRWRERPLEKRKSKRFVAGISEELAKRYAEIKRDEVFDDFYNWYYVDSSKIIRGQTSSLERDDILISS